MVVEDCAFVCGSVVVLVAVVLTNGSVRGCGTYYCGSACGGHLALNLSELQAW